jgi:hypothetical protein
MASKANIVVDQGATFATDILLVDNSDNPLDLTGYVGVSKMKKSYTTSSAISFAVNVSSGLVTLSLNNAVTSTIEPGRYVYDVVLSSSAANTSIRILEGIVTVTPGVSR